jgi:hypothetical protein
VKWPAGPQRSAATAHVGTSTAWPWSSSPVAPGARGSVCYQQATHTLTTKLLVRYLSQVHSCLILSNLAYRKSSLRPRTIAAKILLNTFQCPGKAVYLKLQRERTRLRLQTQTSCISACNLSMTENFRADKKSPKFHIMYFHSQTSLCIVYRRSTVPAYNTMQYYKEFPTFRTTHIPSLFPITTLTLPNYSILLGRWQQQVSPKHRNLPQYRRVLMRGDVINARPSWLLCRVVLAVASDVSGATTATSLCPSATTVTVKLTTVQFFAILILTDFSHKPISNISLSNAHLRSS